MESFPALDYTSLDPLLTGFLREDIGRGDRTTEALVAATAMGAARIEARADGVIAGVGVARRCFELLAPERFVFESPVNDGERVRAMDVVLKMEGPLAAILTGERTALNLLGRMSGVATLTATLVRQIADTDARLVDTRKTTPGLRVLEKYAVRVGGGHNHRFGLDDGVLIKDNHIAAVGGVAKAVLQARAHVPHGLRIEVEVTTLEELDEALEAGADAVLLDNMTPETVRAAVARAEGRAVVEVSGGITAANVGVYARAGVDLISAGALTHSAPALDVALEVER